MTNPSTPAPVRLTRSQEACLEYVRGEGGRVALTDTNDDPMQRFCDDGNPDTFNQCTALGLLKFTHDSSYDDSWATITPAGIAALTNTEAGR